MAMKHQGRRWSVGFSALCRHKPRCANIYDTESTADITFPCSGLSIHDAVTIVAAVNTIGRPMEEVDAEVRRLDSIARNIVQARPTPACPGAG